jgi:hypothetical protein
MSARLLLVALLVTACSTGIEVAEFRPAQGPRGVMMDLELDPGYLEGDMLRGELLAVREDSLLLSVNGYRDEQDDVRRVVSVAFGIMDRATLDQMGRAQVISQGRARDEAYLDRLRLISRFPQGLSDKLLQDMMSGYDQHALETLPAGD